MFSALKFYLNYIISEESFQVSTAYGVIKVAKIEKLLFLKVILPLISYVDLGGKMNGFCLRGKKIFWGKAFAWRGPEWCRTLCKLSKKKRLLRVVY